MHDSNQPIFMIFLRAKDFIIQIRSIQSKNTLALSFLSLLVEKIICLHRRRHGDQQRFLFEIV